MFPISKNRITAVAKLFVPKLIFLPIPGVLPAVEFDNQFLFKTDKIHNKISEGLLTPEFDSFKLSGSELVPQYYLCMGGFLSQFLGVFC